MNNALTTQYMEKQLENMKKYGKDANFIIETLYNDIDRYDREITKMAQNNDTNNKLYDEFQELREVSYQSIESWKTMLNK